MVPIDLCTTDLLALHSASACQAARVLLRHTPLDTQQWQAYLQHHPHADFARYILSELQHGFRIGVRQAAPLHSATTNMLSATQTPQVIRDYQIKELEVCNIFGLFNPQAITNLHTNRFGAIPKKH